MEKYDEYQRIEPMRNPWLADLCMLALVLCIALVASLGGI